MKIKYGVSWTAFVLSMVALVQTAPAQLSVGAKDAAGRVFFTEAGGVMQGPLTNHAGFYGDGYGLTNLNASANHLATGTPVYSESDPLWLSEKSQYATGTPLYGYAESDPVWMSERSHYATGTPLYGFTEMDPAWASASNLYLRTNLAASTYLKKTGDTMSGALNMGGLAINNLASPELASSAATRSYVDTALNSLSVSQLVTAMTIAPDSIGLYPGDAVQLYNGLAERAGFHAGADTWQDFTSHAANLHAIAQNDQTFIAAYGDYDNGNQGLAAIGHVLEREVSWGSTNIFNAGYTSRPRLLRINSSQLVVFFETMTPFEGWARVGTFDGWGDVSWGSVTQISHHMSAAYDTVLLGSNRVIIVTEDGYASLCTVQGDVLRVDREMSMSSSSSYAGITAARLSSDRFVFLFRDETDGQKGKMVIASISGSSLIESTPTIFCTNSTLYYDIACLDAASMVVSYQDHGADDYGMTILGSVGVSDVVQWGTPHPFNTEQTRKIVMEPLDHNRCVMAYGRATDYLCSIGEKTGNSMTWHPMDNSIASIGDNEVSIGILDPSHFVIVHSWSTWLRAFASSVGIPIGFATEFQPPGSDCRIALGGIITSPYIALDPGASYYIDVDGRLTREITAYKAGIALSNNQLLMTPQSVSDSTHSSSESVLVDGSRAMTGPLNMGGNTITSLALPTASDAAATKGYVDAHPSSQLQGAFPVATGSVINAGDIVQLVEGRITRLTWPFSASTSFNASAVGHLQGVALDDHRFVFAFLDTLDSGNGQIILGVVTNESIVWSEASIFHTNTGLMEISLDALDAQHIVVAYSGEDMGWSNTVATVAEIDGMTFNWGMPVNCSEDLHIGFAPLAAINATNFIVHFSDYDHPLSYTRLGMVTGTEISWGPPTVIWSNQSILLTHQRLDDQTVLSYVMDYMSNSYGYAIAGRLHAPDIELGSPCLFNAQTTWMARAVHSSPTNILLAYGSPNGTERFTEFRFGELQDSLEILWSSAIPFGEAGSLPHSLAQISPTNLLLTYWNTDWDRMMLMAGSMQETNLLWQHPAIIGGQNGETTVLLTNDLFVLGLVDSSSYALLGSMDLTSFGMPIGIAAESKIGGEACLVTYAGLANSPVPLVVDHLYYVDSAGNWTTNPAGNSLIGRAVSATQLLTSIASGSSSNSSEEAVLVDGRRAMTGNLNAGGNRIVSVAEPTDDHDAATKNYVDTHGGGGGSASQLVQSYLVKEGSSISAGDVVQFMNGSITHQGNGWSAATNFSEHCAFEGKAALLDDSTFVIIYSDPNNGNLGNAQIGKIDGTTMAWGEPHVFGGNSVSLFGVTPLESNRFLIAYNEAPDNYGESLLASVDNLDIAWISSNLFHAATTFAGSIIAIDSQHALVAYSDDLLGGVVSEGVISDTEVTWNPPSAFTEHAIDQPSLCALSAQRIAISFCDRVLGNAGRLVLGDYQESAFSWISTNTYCDTSFFSKTEALSSTRLLVAYRDDGENSKGCVRLATISDGSNVAWSSRSVFNATNTFIGSLAKKSASHFFLSYHDEALQGRGFTLAGSILGSSISWASPQMFVEHDAGGSIILPVNSTQFVLAYSFFDSTSGATKGDACVGQFARPIGMARETKSAGESCSVVIAGEAEIPTELEVGSLYFLNSEGALAPYGDVQMGMAVSTNRLLLNIVWP